MTLAFLAAIGIAVSYGLATVLQSIGAKRLHASDGLDPGLLVRVFGSLPYLAGLGLDAVGFGLTILALQTLPLFVVESFAAGSLAVTAVAAALWLRLPLSRAEWAGVAGVTIGLVAVGLSAGPSRDVPLGTFAGWLPLIAALGLVAVTVPAARISGEVGVAVLGGIAGLGYGLVGIATRALDEDRTWRDLLTDPCTYAIVVAGGLAILALATALQRGSVTRATAAMVVAETVLPSIIGLAFLGDTIRPGFEVVAVVGLIVAIAGSVALARMGEVPEQSDTTVPEHA